MIVGMNHFTVIAEDRAEDAGLLHAACWACSEGPRPDLGFPGAWLYGRWTAGGAAQCYFERPVPPERSG